jgi:molybdenum cofactor cytidylyltransferase
MSVSALSPPSLQPAAGRATSLPIGVLLAAGFGKRYDPTGKCSKLLQHVPSGKHAGVPIVAAAARNLKPAVGRTLAVVRPRSDPNQHQLQDLLENEGCELVVCEHAADGMGASLACGVRAATDAGGWIVALGDMPAVQTHTIDAVVQALQQGHSTVAPTYQGQRGHPVGFSVRCLDDLLACDGDQGARAVLDKFPPHVIAARDDGILIDIDTR